MQVSSQNRQQAIFAAILVVIAIASRVVFNELHIYNFSAVMAAALFGGAFIANRSLKFAIPMVAMLATDGWLGVYNVGIMLTVYAAFALTVFLGDRYAAKPSMTRYAGSVLGGSLSFFILTNLAVWLFGDGTMYPRTFDGLIQSYTMAIPFYKNTLVSDLIFTTLFFGSFELLRYRRSELVKVKA